jgi:hypothetical protein
LERRHWRQLPERRAGTAGITSYGAGGEEVVQVDREARLRRWALLHDPTRYFNSSLDGNVKRAIDIREAEELDA